MDGHTRRATSKYFHLLATRRAKRFAQRYDPADHAIRKAVIEAAKINPTFRLADVTTKTVGMTECDHGSSAVEIGETCPDPEIHDNGAIQVTTKYKVVYGGNNTPLTIQLKIGEPTQWHRDHGRYPPADITFIGKKGDERSVDGHQRFSADPGRVHHFEEAFIKWVRKITPEQDATPSAGPAAEAPGPTT